MKSTDAYGMLTAAGYEDPVSIDTVAHELGIGRGEASDTIAGMVNAGLATRLRRGVILLKPAGELGTQTLGNDAYRAAIALADPGQSYIGFYTALHHHGLVVRPATTVYVASVARRRSRIVGGIPIKYVTISPERCFGLINSDGVPWSDPERTLVDALARPEYCGQMRTVVSAFRRYSADLNPHRLREHLESFGVAAVAKRAEYIMDRLGIGDGTPARMAVSRHKHYTLLDPHGPTTGTRHPAFEIADNLAPETWNGP